jgi:activator of 2-hydroxyglutaryl-CoA dehydratase
VGSVIELGGQDAKIIMFRERSARTAVDKSAFTSMNDKCASGTGATIDKCMIKVGMPLEELADLKFDPTKLHHVAAKCGVFAETDIVNLVKSGIPADEIMNSLADAIVHQNLSVLTRGNTLRHEGPAARRPEHLPAVPGRVLAAAHPRDLGDRAGTSGPRTGRSRS